MGFDEIIYKFAVIAEQASWIHGISKDETEFTNEIKERLKELDNAVREVIVLAN